MINNFSIEVIGEIEDPDDDNVDVFVHFENGEQYFASFFTLKNIERLNRKNRESGECSYGLYFWSSDMIIIEEITTENIRKSVEDFLETSGFYIAFEAANKSAKERKLKECGEFR